VRRSTVYRTSRRVRPVRRLQRALDGGQPPSGPRPLAAIEDPDERLRSSLEELYAFYRRTEGMLSNLLRDEATVPAIRQRFQGFHDYIAAARDTLMAGRGTRGRARGRVRASLGHAVAFTTWRSLAREQGLDDPAAADLMCRLVAGRRSERHTSALRRGCVACCVAYIALHDTRPIRVGVLSRCAGHGGWTPHPLGAPGPEPTNALRGLRRAYTPL